MYLKSLELQGFKSFPDKIELDFGKGLTAVVGPNGSGKSNIGDAVRWVLGEQSSKSLRGGKMEDVIFSGTQSRKQVGFAKVTLNIDNVSRSLPLDEDLVSVSRKLYRNGDSEYVINGKNVRLKDILELFMDTGLGKDGYSIIGQGKVAEIVSNKSAERRQIFEEAAGISKFRYKKEEATRRLSAAEENILRLKDIILELEDRVGPLKIQSEKAAQFITLAEEKKGLEISLWLEKLNSIKEDIQSAQDTYLMSSSEYEQLENDIVKIEGEIEEFFQKMQQASIKKEKLRNEIMDTEKGNGEINATIAVLRNDILYSEKEIETVKNQVENLKLDGEKSTKLIAEKEEVIAKTIAQKAETSKKIISDTRELEMLAGQSKETNSNFSRENEELNKLYIEKSRLDYTINSAETTFEELEEAVRIANDNSAVLSESYSEIQKRLINAKEFITILEDKKVEHENKISGFIKLLEGRKNRLENAKNEQIQGKLKLGELTQKSKLLADLERNMEGFAYSVKEIIKAGQNGRISGIFGSIAQIITTSSEYSLAIETALGGAMQNIIVENEDTAKRGIRLLKEMRAGRATFLPITSVKGYSLSEKGLDLQDGYVDLAVNLVDFDDKFNGVISSLLGRVVVVEDIDCGTVIAKKYGYKFKIVTLDGQVINAGGSFTGGSASKTTGVFSRKNEIEKISADIAELNHKMQDLTTNVENYQAEVDKLNFDIEGERELLSVVNSDFASTNAEVSHVNTLLENKNIEILTNEQNKKNFAEKLNSQQTSRKEAVLALEKIGEEIFILEENVKKSKSENDILSEKREELSTSISENKLKELELSKDIEALKENVLSLKNAILDREKNLLEYDRQILVLTEKIENCNKEIALNEAKMDNSKTFIDEINKQIQDVTSEHIEFERLSNERRALLKVKGEEKEKVSRESAILYERKNTLQKEYDGIISELWEQYELTRSGAMEIAIEIEDVKVAQKRLNEIKNKIRSLGSINLEAIEEYEEVSKRYEFMSTQLNDVEDAKKQLVNLIDDLTENMKRLFSENFNAINKNFKEIFVELFGGGRGQLTLTEPENILESGIEIEVEPPGKVIKNLSLLSGGEQAFVAIAIYFSILKIKPAPFCILDEIEAALDEVNVSKYASYLHNFTDTTQFILITHRRGSMEEADVLYGVTMQEKGVSKLLKMNAGETVGVEN